MTMARGFQLLRSGMPGVEVVAADSAHAFGRHTHDEFGVGFRRDDPVLDLPLGHLVFFSVRRRVS